jgi:type III pantothenate kinase
MKSLVIDIGNTNVKYAVFEDDVIIHFKKITRKEAVKNLKKDIEKFKPAYAIVADVANASRAIIKSLKNVKQIKWNKKLKLPIINKYKSETLGQDRVALASGANRLFPGKNVLIISAGTSITYDFVNSKAEYLGGAISPGLQMRANALHHFTAKLPEVKLKRQFVLTGNTTQSSILSGVMNGAIQEVKGVINQYHEKYEDLQVILTGGDAEYFDAELKNQIFARRHLALEGLNKILQLNIREE